MDSAFASMRTFRRWRRAVYRSPSCDILWGSRATLSRAICAAFPPYLSLSAPASQQFCRAVLDGEAAALEALEPLATAIGMALAERDAYEPALGAQIQRLPGLAVSLW